jgi:hypothetical protein
MNVAILHYHLNRGGVTQVIRNHLLALDAVLEPAEPLRVALVYGGRQVGWPQDFPDRLRSIRLALHALPSLDYDEAQPEGPPQPDTLAGPLIALLDELELGPGETVVHVHNHAVGKNVALPTSVWALAERGYAILLQVHDFVEDSRPGGFRRFSDAMGAGPWAASWHGRLYPQAPHVHYAVLTGRDRAVLESAGTDTDRLHLLPNPVPEMMTLSPREGARARLAERFAVHRDERFMLYPVRGIRRKNVGEALLYSRLAPPGTVVGLTLPPLNPVAKPFYDRWREVSTELELPCRFDVGAEGGLTFAENLTASDLILTTSVAEGFGMAFLESWLAGRSLVGRDLPEITSDFKQAGIRLDGLRPRVDIPSEWVKVDQLRRSLLEAFRLNLALYQRPQPIDLSEALDAKTGGPLIDFGDLDEPLQERVIERACSSEPCRRELLDANPGIERAFRAHPAEASRRIRENVEAIGRHYALVPSGQRLLNVYRQVASSPRTSSPRPLEHAGRFLDRFLDLTRFRLIHSDMAAGTPEDSADGANG